MEKENTNIFVISIVAIVAIVGMIILFSGQKAVVVQGTPVNTISEIPENSGNLAGQAYTRPEKINYNDLIKEGFEVVRETSKGVQLKNHKTNQIVNFCTDIGGNSCYGSSKVGCSGGEITSECDCGGSSYQDGYCCGDIWNPVGCGETWNRLYLKDFNDGQMTDSILRPFGSSPVAYSIDNGALKGNLRVPGYLKNRHRMLIDLGDLGVDPQGEFYIKSRVKIDANNNWCCTEESSHYCDVAVSGCAYGGDGAKMIYGFGDGSPGSCDDCSWVPSSNPSQMDVFGGWYFTDNRNTGTGYINYFTPPNYFDSEWHELIFYFKHNTYSGGSWNWDGLFEFYSDGVIFERETDVPYTVSGNVGYFDKIDKPVTYFGGAGRLIDDWWYWVDDIEVYAPINPCDSDGTCELSNGETCANCADCYGEQADCDPGETCYGGFCEPEIQGNLIQNPSFELDQGIDFYPGYSRDDDILGNSIPDGWNTYHSTGIMDNKTSYDGDYSVRVSSGSSFQTGNVNQYVPVEEGKTYTVSGWMKVDSTCQANPDCKATLGLHCDIGQASVWNCPIDVDDWPTVNSLDWTYVESQFTVDFPDTTHIELACYNSPLDYSVDSGYVWCDAFSLEEVSSPLVGEGCVDEICANGVDDDCDGLVDEGCGGSNAH